MNNSTVRFGVPQIVTLYHNGKHEPARIVASSIVNGVVTHTVELSDKKFHGPPKHCSLISVMDYDTDLQLA